MTDAWSTPERPALRESVTGFAEDVGGQGGELAGRLLGYVAAPR